MVHSVKKRRPRQLINIWIWKFAMKSATEVPEQWVDACMEFRVQGRKVDMQVDLLHHFLTLVAEMCDVVMAKIGNRS